MAAPDDRSPASSSASASSPHEAARRKAHALAQVHRGLVRLHIAAVGFWLVLFIGGATLLLIGGVTLPTFVPLACFLAALVHGGLIVLHIILGRQAARQTDGS